MGIEQVIDVQLQIDVTVDTIAHFRISHPVAFGGGRRTDGAIAAAMHAADIASACAKGDSIGCLVLAPEGKGVFRRVRQRAGAVPGDVAAFTDAGVLLGISADDLPVRGDITGQRQLITFNAFFTVLRIGAVVVLLDFVLNIGTEKRAVSSRRLSISSHLVPTSLVFAFCGLKSVRLALFPVPLWAEQSYCRPEAAGRSHS